MLLMGFYLSSIERVIRKNYFPHPCASNLVKKILLGNLVAEDFFGNICEVSIVSTYIKSYMDILYRLYSCTFDLYDSMELFRLRR